MVPGQKRRGQQLRPCDDARTRYLNGLAPEKHVAVLLETERLGRAPTDSADWLIAHAASEAAQRIEPAASSLEAANSARLYCLEALLRRQGKPELLVTGPIRDLIIVAMTIRVPILVAVFSRAAAAPVVDVAALSFLGLPARSRT